jgi:hypothetical protein
VVMGFSGDELDRGPFEIDMAGTLRLIGKRTNRIESAWESPPSTSYGLRSQRCDYGGGGSRG